MKKLNRNALTSFVTAMMMCSATFMAEAGIAERAIRTKVAGVDLIIYPMDVKEVVTVAGTLPAGDVYATQGGGNAAVATLTAMMLDKGTAAKDKFAIAKQLDDVGAGLEFGAGAHTVKINGKSLKKDTGLIIRLLAEQLRSPAFSAEELAKAKTQFEAGIRSQMDSTEFRAGEIFSRSIFPADHPNSPVAHKDLLAAVDRASVEDIRKFHRTHYGPSHLTLVFVGDVNKKLIETEVRKAFTGWRGGVEAMRAASREEIPAPEERSVVLPDKASVSIVLGQATGLRFQDADRHALGVATAILGSGFTGRLMSTVRDKEGLTYGINAGLSGDEFVDGAWAISASFSPDLLDKGIASTRRELERWWREGVTASELEARKSNLIGSFHVSLSTTSGMAYSIISSVERGVGIEWLDRYPAVIRSLTVAQVNSAIKKYLDPKKMVLVKAGTLAST